MEFVEIEKNLFTISDKYFLAHCIAEDLKMGAGIAVEFQRQFDLRDEIQEQDHRFPTCVLVGRVFNLITKKKSSDKPTLKTLRGALCSMKLLVTKHNITKIAMPRIGCGLDRLKWEDVKPIIIDVFKDIDPLEIVVCVK